MEVDGAPDAGYPIDLESYIGNYTSHTKLDRLQFIADKCAGTPLELDALKLAATELKKGHNTIRYAKVMGLIDGRLGSAFVFDQEWYDSTERKARQTVERLEGLLTGYKTNLVKESIRMGHNDLGDFHYERGDLQMAFKCYVRTRDYCTTSRHVLSMCLNVIKVSIEMGNFVHANNYIQKAEQTPDLQARGATDLTGASQQSDLLATAKLRCASGLAALASKKYKQAARKLVEVSPDLGGQYSDVFAAQDVAIYGGLCALATFDRTELRQKVINNIGFLEFLELVPEIREVIHDFYNSRYTSCLAQLQALRPSLMLDIHLCDHVAHLFSAIRSRALIQYTTPFTTVDLNCMATAFNTTASSLEEELAALIMEDQIKARIDSHKKLLYAKHADARTAVIKKVISLGEVYERETKFALLRANLHKHDFVVRSRPAKAASSTGPFWQPGSEN